MNRARINAVLRASAGALVLGLSCLGAQAQTSTIDPGIVSSDSIGTSEREVIERHVSEWTPGLSSGDVARVNASRQRLSRPLESATIGITFREAYSDALVPELRTLLAGEDVGARLAALRLAGELATEASAALLLDHLDDADEAVRYFAIGRMASAFEQTSEHPAALSPETTLDMVRALGDKIGATSPLEGDAAVRALGRAMRIDRDGYEGARNEAARLLGARASARIRAISTDPIDESELILALNACAAGRSAVTSTGWQPDRDATRELVGLGGDVLALVFNRFVNQKLPPQGERAVDVQTTRAAENLILFARRHDASLRGSADTINASRLGDLLESGDDRTFRTRALELLGRDGELIRTFNFEPGRFIDR
ncbi:MAG: hypothetical protein ACIARR_01455 [Phycisphaerales bacterium JB059]